MPKTREPPAKLTSLPEGVTVVPENSTQHSDLSTQNTSNVAAATSPKPNVQSPVSNVQSPASSVQSPAPTAHAVPLDSVITRNPNTAQKERLPWRERPAAFVRSIPGTIIGLPKTLKNFFSMWVVHILSFTVLLMVYLLNHLIHWLFSFRLVPESIRSKALAPFAYLFLKLSSGSRTEERTINRINLIDLAMRNMMFKRSRAVITVGGMAIGIAAIVFLVSIGFGMQQLVLTRVARLDELSQMDVSTLPGSKERITDKTISSIKGIKEVSGTLPLIASVAKVTFNNSVTDMAVYAVTSDYLKQSAIQPVHGKIFDSNEIALSERGSVAGMSTEESMLLDEREQRISYSIEPETWVKVRAKPDRSSAIIGYTRRTEGSNLGLRVWGGVYPEAKSAGLLNGKQAAWIRADFPIWQQKNCQSSNPDCDDGHLISKDSTGFQLYETGYIAEVNVSTEVITDTSILGSVLGDSTEDATDSAELASEWVDIASESATTAKEKITKIEVPASAKRLAVVNRAMLKLLGINETEAVGKTFATSFVIVGDLLENSEEKLESIPTDYTIVGVIPEEKTPFFYVPFTDLRSLGVRNYSQLKVVSKSQDTLSSARKQIEALGFSTRSVADTVKQIDRLFATARTVLLILGMVALSVAALGMFNTLTVSLLERTREVGLMKAMGMKSHEVQELFLTESMVMGFFGGVLGICIGWIAGESIGLLLSMFSIGKGVGYIDIAYLPPGFVLFIFFLSLLVGICTGIYPARRATKISALNALRYE